MPDQYSDISGLSEQDQERVRRFRARIPELLRGRAAGRGLHPDKQDFPIGINEDGTANYVDPDGR